MTAARVTAPARLVLLGHPVGHSLSPAIQRAALRSAAIQASYEAVDVEAAALAAALRQLAASGAAGNITIPHKEAAAALMARLTPLAARVGAVNTFWTEDGALVGDNTDVGGFETVATSLIGRSPESLRVAVIGAGGAAAAVLAAVEHWPAARAAIWSRTRARTESLAARYSGVATAAEFLADALRGADLVVNATPIGLHDDAIPVPVALLRHSAAVVDLVYRPGETLWVRQAKARGLRAVDGLPVLIEQGALAFTRWFGAPADREAMWASIR